MPIRSSELRNALSFQRRGAGANPFGEPSGAWAEVIATRGTIEPITETQEIFQALQVGSQDSARIRCRWQSGLTTITTSDRIVSGDVTYDIRAVIEPGTAHKEMHFLVDRHRE